MQEKFNKWMIITQLIKFKEHAVGSVHGLNSVLMPAHRLKDYVELYSNEDY